MTFLEMYGEGLTTELGSSDTTERFTSARRRSAINLGQREFNKLTGCFTREGEIVITGDIPEYDLEANLDAGTYIRLTDQQPWLEITDANANVRVLSGEEFQRADIARKDWEDPGWRSTSSSIPTGWYLRHDSGSIFIGLTPAPSAPAGESWKLYVPYVAKPATMASDADLPFSQTAGGNSKTSLEVYHQGLVHRAAAELEKLRRNYGQVQFQMALFMQFVRDYRTDQRKTGGERVRLAHNYFGSAQMDRNLVAEDPYR